MLALKDREDVLSKARLLKRSNIYVSEDLSRYFEEFFLMTKVLIGFDERKPGRHESTELSCRNSYDRSFIAQWLCQRFHNMEDFKIAIADHNKELLFPNKE